MAFHSRLIAGSSKYNDGAETQRSIVRAFIS
jgi:hypothetical protein